MLQPIKNFDGLITEIFKVIFYTPSEKQIKDVRKIVLMDDITMSIANEICEYLEIPKRGNRANIIFVIDTWE